MADVYLVPPDESSQMHNGSKIESTFTGEDMRLNVVLPAYLDNLQMRVPKIVENSHNRPAQISLLHLARELHQNILSPEIPTTANQLKYF